MNGFDRPTQQGSMQAEADRQAKIFQLLRLGVVLTRACIRVFEGNRGDAMVNENCRTFTRNKISQSEYEGNSPLFL